jgi:hypothetical protein
MLIWSIRKLLKWCRLLRQHTLHICAVTSCPNKDWDSDFTWFPFVVQGECRSVLSNGPRLRLPPSFCNPLLLPSRNYAEAFFNSKLNLIVFDNNILS